MVSVLVSDWCQIGVKNGVNVGVSFCVNTNVRIEMLLINLTGFCYAIIYVPVFLDFPNSVSMCVLCSLGRTGSVVCKPLFSGLLRLFFVLFIFRGNTIPGKRMAVFPSIPIRSAGMNAFRRGAPSCAPASSAPVDGGRTA